MMEDNQTREERKKEEIDLYLGRVESAPLVYIDCGFEMVGSEKKKKNAIKSLATQIARCYGMNKKSPSPFNLKIVDMPTELLEVLEKQNASKWVGIELSSEPLSSCSNDLIYLTPDSPNILPSSLSSPTPSSTTTSPSSNSPNKGFIIGGIVDRNQRKGESFEKATSELGISHARFPIQEHVDLNSSSTLTILHSFQILLNLYQQQKSDDDSKGDEEEENGEEKENDDEDEVWGRVLGDIIPKRKRKGYESLRTRSRNKAKEKKQRISKCESNLNPSNKREHNEDEEKIEEKDVEEVDPII